VTIANTADYRKKYKKIKFKFDDVYRQSNELCIAEQNAQETAKRLARENELVFCPHLWPLKVNKVYSFLLEMLLDTNDSPQMPADKRIDLDVQTSTPALSAVPSLITSEELERISQPSEPAVDEIHKEIIAIINKKAMEKAASRPPKTLQRLLETTPHITPTSPMISQAVLSELEPLEGYPAPIAYMTAEQIDEYVYEIDATLGIAQGPPPANSQNPPQDLAHRNPHSVYNWLRQHEPKVFLQDGEGSEKSQGKPGSLRGAGKRASMPFPSKPDSLEIVEEDGLGYDPTIAGLEPAAKGNKRKREDDGGYHPKLGAPDGKAIKKPRVRKKKSDASGDTPNSSGSRRGKGKAKASTPSIEGAEPMPSVKKSAFAAALEAQKDKDNISRSTSPEHVEPLPEAPTSAYQGS